MNNKERIDRLHNTHSLAAEDYAELAGTYTLADAVYAASLANAARRQYYGNDVYIRGLIEVGNVCRNDCLYCGIRRSNKSCKRYVLTKEEILSCCIDGYELGFRTFVLQGGEGVMPAEKLCGIVSEIRKKHLDCAITLSFGEYPRRDYKNMYAAGANRYLLRHETANKQHYEKLHPASMSFDNRMRCLRDLKEIGFQVGCGFMVGSPYQTTETLAEDLKFIEGFRPDMCGIGPFIPHEDTPFGAYPAGSIDLTVFLLSLVRLIKPNILLPATTALGSVEEGGRERGIRAGANVVMPNLSPFSVREKYALYNNKLSSGIEPAQSLALLKKQMNGIGYRIVCARGDIIK